MLRRFAIAGTIAMLIPIGVHAYLAKTSRYVGDDYCAAGVFNENGLVGGQVWFYKYWNAVPTVLALMAATHPGDVEIASVLPAMTLVAWFVAAAWTVRKLVALLGVACSWAIASLIAALALFATLETTPNIVQTLYLRIPMLAYVFPLFALTAFAGLIASLVARGAVSWVSLVVVGFIAFVLGAFGPVSVASQITLLTLVGLVALVVRSPTAIRLLAAAFVGSFAALLFVVLAPGNASRQHMFPTPPGVFTIGKWSVLYTGFMFVRPVLGALHTTIVEMVPAVLGSTPSWLPMAMGMAVSPVVVILMILIPVIVVFMSADDAAARRLERHANAALLLIPPAMFVLVMSCMAPAAYGTSSPPPPRALVIPGFFIVCAAIAWGSALGVRLRTAGVPHGLVRGTAMAVVALTLWSVTTATIVASRRSGELTAWAARWDETDRQLRHAHATGNMKPTVPVVGSIAGVGSIAVDPNDWVNICAARYYRLEAISGTSIR
jgi:hypothetical protein